ncbi:TRAP transporter substrate-binding protein [Propionibacteriaceae bacterium G1746]
MWKKFRVAAVAATAIASLVLAGCGGGDAGSSAENYTIKIALNQTETHPSFIALDAFGKKLKEDTNGRWNLQVYPNSQLGDQKEYLQSVSTGVYDMAVVSAPQLENLNKDFVIFSLPKVFDSIDHQMKVLADQNVVGDVYKSLETSNNITVVGGLTQGARSVYTKDKIANTPADLAGKKIRVQESPVFLSMIKALGASPTPMAYSEVYTGLQSGVIDGAENNEISYATQKHFEVAPYFSYSRHLIGADFLIINTKTLNKMSSEDRASFDKGWEATWKQHTELWKTDTEKAIKTATDGGAKFQEVDIDAYAKALEPLQNEFLKTEPQKALLEKIKAVK